jgi:hypothetical protein
MSISMACGVTSAGPSDPEISSEPENAWPAARVAIGARVDTPGDNLEGPTSSDVSASLEALPDS